MKTKLLIGLLVLLTLITGCDKNNNENEGHINHIEKIELDEEIGYFDLVGKTVINEKNQYLASLYMDTLIFPGESYVTYSTNYEKEKYSELSLRQIIKLNSFNIFIRDIETNELIKQLDIKEILDENYPEYQIATVSVKPHATTVYEGRKCIVFVVEIIPADLEKEEVMEMHNLYVSIEDNYHNIDMKTTVYYRNGLEYNDSMKNLLCTDILEKNGIDAYYSFDGNNPYWVGTPWESLQVLRVKSLSKNNKELLEIFPNTEQYLDENYLTLFADDLSDDEIIGLLLEDGRELDKTQITLSSYCSIDEESHVINGQEDWDLYFKVPESSEEDVFRYE